MRSGLVFHASERIPNRFLLCRVLAAAARKMHRDGVSTSQCINLSLTTLSQKSEQAELPPQTAQLPPRTAEELVVEAAAALP
jgi:hypothetical protein